MRVYIAATVISLASIAGTSYASEESHIATCSFYLDSKLSGQALYVMGFYDATVRAQEQIGELMTNLERQEEGDAALRNAMNAALVGVSMTIAFPAAESLPADTWGAVAERTARWCRKFRNYSARTALQLAILSADPNK
jgi:hypothetical protein